MPGVSPANERAPIIMCHGEVTEWCGTPPLHLLLQLLVHVTARPCWSVRCWSSASAIHTYTELHFIHGTSASPCALGHLQQRPACLL